MGRLYAISICFIFSLCMESNALEKFITNSVAKRFFARTPSMIQRIVRICDLVDRFLWKSFGFFLRIFAASGRIRLKLNSLLSISLLCFVLTQPCIIEEVSHWIFLSSKLQEIFRWVRQHFYFFLFFSTATRSLPKQRDSLIGANTNGNECYLLCHTRFR